MASASSLLHLPPFLSRGVQTSIKSNSIQFQIHRRPTTLISASSDPSSSPEREEIRWLREEQRWLREEQRWLRLESRWNSERDSLRREIAALRLQIEALEREKSSLASLANAASDLASALNSLKDLDPKPRRITAESGSGPRPTVLEEVDVKEMVLDAAEVSEGRDEAEKDLEAKKKKAALRRGSEGKGVLEMQEALAKLGFYSGEEDMEYSSFSSGTERAVKTWQATLGISEDGIMTTELMEKLFMENKAVNTDLKANVSRSEDPFYAPEKDIANGAPAASVTEISEIQQSVLKENGVTEVEVSQHRVFLLGENRWEEPSRLGGKGQLARGGKGVAGTKCLTCRGEGHLMCTECDGTGELNVEPQFLDWVDEGAKCPYCEGSGHTACDVCEGKGTAGV